MAEAQEEAKKQKLPLSVKFALFIITVISVYFFPSTVLFCACMVPTFVAAIVDNHAQRTAWLTVGCMNFAGTVPAWFHLWEKGQRIDHAFDLMFQGGTLLVAYGAAAVGWILYHNITPFVAGIIVMRTEKRLKDIEKRQKELIAKWGQDVTGA